MVGTNETDFPHRLLLTDRYIANVVKLGVQNFQCM